MQQNKHGEIIFSQNDIANLVMQGWKNFDGFVVDNSVDLSTVADLLETVPVLIKYNQLIENISTEEFDQQCQSNWHMPQHYKDLEIAEYVLKLCTTDAELQRCGKELMLFQDRGLFNLLRYLKYLVDVLQENKIIWGVGRGSSVASFVLYKLGVHKIDSMYYELDPEEFLR
jgi:DNA polymerase III alpha subunit